MTIPTFNSAVQALSIVNGWLMVLLFKMMKIFFIALSLTFFFQACSDESTPDSTADYPASETNVSGLARSIMISNGQQFSDSEYRSLEKASDLILALVNTDRFEGPHLVRVLRPNPDRVNVEWHGIVDAVKSGKVVGGVAPHSGIVTVWTTDGRELTAKAPDVDALGKLCKEVDPLGIFINLMIE